MWAPALLLASQSDREEALGSRIIVIYETELAGHLFPLIQGGEQSSVWG